MKFASAQFNGKVFRTWILAAMQIIFLRKSEAKKEKYINIAIYEALINRSWVIVVQNCAIKTYITCWFCRAA